MRRPRLTGLMIHCTARMTMALLRNPAVTVSAFHMLSYSGRPYSIFAPDANGGGFVEAGPGTVLRWFNKAANGGAKHQQVHIDGAVRVPGGDAFPDEGYYDVEAALFIKEPGATLIIHNANREGRKLDLSSFRQGKIPSIIETFDTPDLTKDYARQAPPVRALKAALEIEVPGYSLTRVIWD